MWVAFEFGSALDFCMTEFFTEPADRGSSGDGSPEDVEFFLSLIDVGHGNEAMTGIGLVVDIAPAHAGADHGDMVAGVGHACSQGRHCCVHAAAHDRHSGRKAEFFCPFRAETADDFARFHQARRHHFKGNAEHLQGFFAPAATAHVVNATDVAGRTVVNGDFAGQQVIHIAVGWQEVANLLPDFRALVLDPQHLGVTVVAVDAVAGELHEALKVKGVFDPFDFTDGAPIHPDQTRVKRFHLAIDRNARTAVKAGDT